MPSLVPTCSLFFSIAKPAPPNHVDSTVSQPFRRWTSTLRRRHLEHREGRHAEAPCLCSISKMSTRMGRYRQITCTGPISRMSESMTSSIEVNTASMTVGSTSIAPRSDAGCLGKDRVGRSSHYSDARRSVDSHHSTPGPIVDKSAPVTPTSKNHRRADSLRGRLHRRPHNFENLCHWN
jgi:hypothetical protein